MEGEKGTAPLLTLNQGANWQESRPALNWQEGNVVGIQRTGGQAPPHLPPLSEQQPEQGKMMVFAGLLLVFSAFFAFLNHTLTTSPSPVWKQENNPKN